MSADAKALRNALVYMQNNPKVTRFSRGDKRIAMTIVSGDISLQWRFMPKELSH